jgi:hypothetical protein
MATLQPVDFDPFGASTTPGGVPVGPNGVPRVHIGDASNVGPQLVPVDHDPFAQPSAMEDVAKSAGIGAAKGAIGMAGVAGDLRQLLSAGVDYAAQHFGIPADKVQQFKDTVYQGAKMLPPTAAVAEAPTSSDIQKGIERYTGDFYKPKTTAGEYAQTAGEFLPAAFGGEAGLVGRVARVLVPAVSSETAGQATKGTAIEPAARFLGALAGGGATALASRPGTASRAIQQQLPDGITPQMVNQADALIQDAAARGIQLAWPEALSQVAGRPVLTNMMRHLEASPQTENQMATFFGQRPQQVENAVRDELGNISPVNANPSGIGPTVGGVGEDIATRIRAAINTATRPMYDAARQHLVPRQVHAAMMDDPLFEQALNAVRNDPARNSFVRGQSDRSVAVYDAVKKELEERAQNAAQPLNPNASQAVASATGSLGNDVRDIAIASERAATNGPSAYQAALATQARLREQYLTPFLNSPLGKAAGRDTTTKQAIEALFPSQPLANSQNEVGQSVRALSNRNPRAAENLVRAHIEGVFNEAAKDLQTGANQAGGAKFRTRLVGNPQQAANLEAAVSALPNGAQRWQGFNRLLDVLEATGTRQGIGSRTAYNAEINKLQGAGGTIQAGAKIVANPMRFLQPLAEKYEQYKLGRNLNELANILTNPRSANLLRAAARAPHSALPGIALKLVAFMQSSRPVDNRNNR